MKRVHLDHNATTPVRPEVRAFWLERLDALGGNPSSVHRAGRAARQVLDEARERTAAALGVHEDEIYFTSGGTEANNLALLGSVRRSAATRGLVTTAVEHSSVLGAAEQLEREGRRVERVGVDARGGADVEAIAERARTSGAALVSAMAANNETGAVLDLEQLGGALAQLGADPPIFHTDAVQALGRIPVDLRRWGADLASFSAHKVGGPLGVGVLYRRRETSVPSRARAAASSTASKAAVALDPILHGGGQEGGLRPGTENVPAIAAASLAIELGVREQVEYAERAQDLVRAFWQRVQSEIPRVEILGPEIDSPLRLANTLNISIDGIDGRMLVARLDLEGLEVSAGSACASGSLEPSHVLLAMGLSPERARSGLRVSVGRTTNIQDIHMAVDILRRTVATQR